MDRAAIAEVTRRRLPGIDIRFADSGDEAVQAVRTDPAVALVLMADHMLRVGGAGTILAIRDAAPQVRVAVFGMISEREAADWAREGLDGILSRRLEPDRFGDALKFLLSGNRYASPEVFDQAAGHAGYCAFLGTCGRHFPLLDDLPMVLFLVQQGQVAYANRAALGMLGLEEAAVLNRPFAGLLAPQSRPILEASLAEGAEQIPPALRLALPERDGHLRWIETQWSRIDLAGAPALCCVCMDLGNRSGPSAGGDPVSGGGEAAADLPPGLERLTMRQRQVLELLGLGITNKEIATRLRIAEATVKLHVHHILRALGVNNRTEAALLTRGVAFDTPEDRTGI